MSTPFPGKDVVSEELADHGANTVPGLEAGVSGWHRAWGFAASWPRLCGKGRVRSCCLRVWAERRPLAPFLPGTLQWEGGGTSFRNSACSSLDYVWSSPQCRSGYLWMSFVSSTTTLFPQVFTIWKSLIFLSDSSWFYHNLAPRAFKRKKISWCVGWVMLCENEQFIPSTRSSNITFAENTCLLGVLFHERKNEVTLLFNSFAKLHKTKQHFLM